MRWEGGGGGGGGEGNIEIIYKFCLNLKCWKTQTNLK